VQLATETKTKEEEEFCKKKEIEHAYRIGEIDIKEKRARGSMFEALKGGCLGIGDS